MGKNSVIILGNGFDLALGLETRYSDFYKSKLWKNDSDIKNRLKDSESPLVTFLKKEYKNNENWFDLEKTIKKFALGLQTDSKVDSVKWEFNTLLKQRLKGYLKQEVAKFLEVNKDRDLNAIANNPSPDSLVEEVLSLINNGSVFVYTFNYTVINEYLRSCKEEMPNVYHVHGTLHDADIKLGLSLKNGEK